MDSAPRYKCLNCQDQRLVCENHPNLPWDVPGGCNCGPGMPCEYCNPCDRDNPPILQPGFDIKATRRQ